MTDRPHKPVKYKKAEGVMLTKYSLKMPREVYSGENALENIKPILVKNHVKKEVEYLNSTLLFL